MSPATIPNPPVRPELEPPPPSLMDAGDPLGNPYDFDSPGAYRRRFYISIVWSIVINLMLIWLVFTVDLSRKSVLEAQARAKAKNRGEFPKLILTPRVVPAPPKPPSPPKRVFLETDPSQAVPEKPENAQFYSEQNTVATQTKATPVKSADTPFADGSNTKTMATETVLPNVRPPAPPAPPQPAEPQPPPSPPKAAAAPSPPPQPVAKPPSPQPAPKEGELAMLRMTAPPEKPPAKESKEAKETKEVKPADKESKPSENQANKEPVPKVPAAPPSPPQPANVSSRQVMASKSRLDGGVKRTGEQLAFNSAASPFAKYDKKIVAKIGAYFQALNRERVYGGELAGEVEVSFRLLPNGQISDLKVTNNTANQFVGALCLEVMQRSVPFEPFPEAMKAMVGEFREAEIRFIY